MDNGNGHKDIQWQPQEIIEIGDGLKMGIAIDGGYFVVLSMNGGGTWKPANCIPLRVAKRLGELATSQIATALFANAP